MGHHKWNGVHINANDLEVEGEWRDSNGKRLTFFDWHHGNHAMWKPSLQPDNYQGLDHYVHVAEKKIYTNGVYQGTTIKWNDHKANLNAKVICERKPQKVNSGRDPSERLSALTEKALEVVELSGSEKNSPLWRRVSKKLSILTGKVDQKRADLIEKGCEFPAHWTGRNIKLHKKAIGLTAKTHAKQFNKSFSDLIAGFISTPKIVRSQMIRSLTFTRARSTS